jgi:hypothetical protein
VKAPALQDIKNEIKELPPKRLAELCVALAKFRKENKEYLGYLLFDEATREDYVREVISEVTSAVMDIERTQTPYFTKKNLRRIQRLITRHCRFMADPVPTAEVHIAFVKAIAESSIPFRKHLQLSNIYHQELRKVRAAIDGMHEDLRGDFEKELAGLEG